jgi:hypothetical protein
MWSGDPWRSIDSNLCSNNFKYLRGSYAEVDGPVSTGIDPQLPSICGRVIKCGVDIMRGAGKNIDCCGVTTALAKATFHLNINYLDRLKAQSRHVSVSSQSDVFAKNKHHGFPLEIQAESQRSILHQTPQL